MHRRSRETSNNLTQLSKVNSLEIKFLQINFPLKNCPQQSRVWERHSSSSFSQSAQTWPVCFPFPGFPSTCCLSYRLRGRHTAVAIPLTHERTAQHGTESRVAAPIAAPSCLHLQTPRSTTAPTVAGPPGSRYLLSPCR